jgi:hypothetical protein
MRLDGGVMRPGEIVTLYTDPREQTLPEEEAELLKKLGTWRGLEYWRVRLLRDGFISARLIKGGDNQKGEGRLAPAPMEE